MTYIEACNKCHLVSDDTDDLPRHAAASTPATTGSSRQYPATVLLTSTNIDEAVIYETSAMNSGLVSVVVRAVDRDTSVGLYATTAPYADPIATSSSSSDTMMTSLPVTVRTTPDSLTVSWKPVARSTLSAAAAGASVEYCVSVSPLRHFRTRCAVARFVDGDPEPPAPPNAGYGFPWERKAAQRQRQRSRQSQRTAETTARRNRGQVFYTCVGANTSYTHR